MACTLRLRPEGHGVHARLPSDLPLGLSRHRGAISPNDVPASTRPRAVCNGPGLVVLAPGHRATRPSGEPDRREGQPPSHPSFALPGALRCSTPWGQGGRSTTSTMLVRRVRWPCCPFAHIEVLCPSPGATYRLDRAGALPWARSPPWVRSTSAVKDTKHLSLCLLGPLLLERAPDRPPFRAGGDPGSTCAGRESREPFAVRLPRSSAMPTSSSRSRPGRRRSTVPRSRQLLCLSGRSAEPLFKTRLAWRPGGPPRDLADVAFTTHEGSHLPSADKVVLDDRGQMRAGRLGACAPMSTPG